MQVLLYPTLWKSSQNFWGQEFRVVEGGFSLSRLSYMAIRGILPPPPPPPGLYSSHINHLYIPYLPYIPTIPSPQLGTGHNTYKTLKIGPSAPVGIAVPAHSLLKQRKTDPHSARQGPNSRTGIMLFNVEKDTGLCSQYYQMPDLVSALQ